ncbi:MAG: sensor histidine kinase [Chlorobiales bacterium]
MQKPNEPRQSFSIVEKSRYAELVVFGLIFILLVAAMFLLNYFLSIKSSDDAAQTFCANRTERAWQRAVKSLTAFNIGFYGQDDSLLNAFSGYKENIKRFDSLLTALAVGGVVNADGQNVEVTPIEDETTKEIFEQLNALWQESKSDFLGLAEMNPKMVATAMLDRCVEYAIKKDDEILDVLSLLIINLSENSSRRLKQAQLVQVGALLTCVVMFIGMAIRLTISLRRSDAIIEARNLEVMVQRDELAREKETIEHLLIDLTNTQAQLIQSEKMASLGQMVAGLAHEINTPLGFVTINVGVIDRNIGLFSEAIMQTSELVSMLENGDLNEALQKLDHTKCLLQRIFDLNLLEKTKNRINEATIGLERIRELIINLKNFSRLDEAEMKKVDLKESIESALLIANNLIKHKAEVETYYEENLAVECYPAQLNQVFLNIITNAVQAIPEFGKITIRTWTENGSVKISIADTGVGISEANLKRIFEPFFTTKPTGQGTGLGLSIVYKIIERHDGKIDVKSKVGEGTEFIITLPLRQEEARIDPSLTIS